MVAPEASCVSTRKSGVEALAGRPPPSATSSVNRTSNRRCCVVRSP
jgi:hypothetical protein